ncbi:MAG: methyltransferase domain-containing protein [Candidatus Omnitrophica bacterium]|nr:methyltransferase domain-containing protein [Candidatus Omnitrophota bacterium]
MDRVNIGCGQTPTAGWKNFDNSLSVRLAQWPLLVSALKKMRGLNKGQQEFIGFAEKHQIGYADAVRHIPLRDQSVEVLYTSHMLEHLSEAEVGVFLRESQRVLCPGGIIRIVVPDLKWLVEQYVTSGDADEFIRETLLSAPMPRSFLARIKYFLAGQRNHQWMYDSTSLCRVLATASFSDPRVMEAGTTRISNPGALDLSERSPGSVYVEAVNL